MPFEYDHNDKAGNEGDICKHPALIAAIDKTIFKSATPFRYADIFAGYEMNRLNESGEWRNGIGLVGGPHLLAGSADIALWASWAGLIAKPAPGGTYPGSAWFAREVCKARKRPVELKLWDTGTRPFNSLATAFSGTHRVFNEAARPGQSELQRADFVFIDPPSNGNWPEIERILRQLPLSCSVVVWLPVFVDATKRPPTESGLSEDIRLEALGLRFDVSKVIWATGGRMIGCQLLCRLNPGARLALRKALDGIVAIARQWRGESRKWHKPPIHYNVFEGSFSHPSRKD